MAFFLHYAAHGDFEDGILAPFNSQVEAERQAACDLLNGCDEDYIERIFEAPYEIPRRAWLRSQIDATVDEEGQPVDAFANTLPHLLEEHRKTVVTGARIRKIAPKHQDDLLHEMLKAQADQIIEIDRAIRSGRAFENSVPGNAYTWMVGGTATGGATALSAATAKTLVLILAAAANQPAITEVGISFDGVTASAVPVLVELVSGTAGAAGTPRAALAAGKQIRGWPAAASQTTCADAYTAEPTTQLANRKWLVTPNAGLLTIQSPLGREPTGIITAATDAKTWSIRATAPATVNAHSYIEYEE